MSVPVSPGPTGTTEGATNGKSAGTSTSASEPMPPTGRRAASTVSSVRRASPLRERNTP